MSITEINITPAGPTLPIDPRCALEPVLEWMVGQLPTDGSAIDVVVHPDVASYVASIRTKRHPFAHGRTEEDAKRRLHVMVEHGIVIDVPAEVWRPSLVPYVAESFAGMVRDEILRYTDGHERLQRIVQRNQEEADPSICHMHDYCDPNVFMDIAISSATGQEPSSEDMLNHEGIRALWDEAWAQGKLVLAQLVQADQDRAARSRRQRG